MTRSPDGRPEITYDPSRNGYRVCIELSSDPLTGKRRPKTLRAKTRSELVLRLASIETEAGRADTLTLGDTTLQTCAERWLAIVQMRGRKDSAVGSHRISLNNHVLPQLGRLRLREITPEHIELTLSRIRQLRGDTGRPLGVWQEGCAEDDPRLLDGGSPSRAHQLQPSAARCHAARTPTRHQDPHSRRDPTRARRRSHQGERHQVGRRDPLRPATERSDRSAVVRHRSHQPSAPRSTSPTPPAVAARLLTSDAHVRTTTT